MVTSGLRIAGVIAILVAVSSTLSAQEMIDFICNENEPSTHTIGWAPPTVEGRIRTAPVM